MRVGQDFHPKSSFLSLEKDYNLIFEKLLKNQRLLKMLYYPQPDCLKATDLTQKEILSMIGKQIRIVPKYTYDDTCPNFIVISMDNFVPNATNPEFRDCAISFDILCHYDYWNMKDFQLRPFKIAGEIDAMFNKSRLTGIGQLFLAGAKDFSVSDDLGGVAMVYAAIHGIEDQIMPLNE